MLNSKKHTEDMDVLFDALLRLKNREEVCSFFEDLCTISELQAMAQRYRVARLLQEGSTCHDIAKSTGCSTATISRVSRCLHYGTGGYALALERESEATLPAQSTENG